jgi:sulfotransferase
MKNVYFISGLPRSGSTLLCNILAQNDNLFVSKATSGCHDILFNIRNQWDKLIEHQAEGVDHDQLKRVLQNVLNSYHSTDKNIIIDKGRGWLSLIEMVEFITGQTPKIIVPVRNISEILSSFEKLWRKSTGFSQWNFEQSDYFKAQTVEGRCDIWASAGQPVGLAYNRIKDAISRGYGDKILFLEFDELTSTPSQSLKTVYDYLELPYFQHNFKNIEQYTKEDDEGVHRIPNLHTIRPQILPVPHDSTKILGDFLANKYPNLELWRNYNERIYEKR